VTGVLIRRKFGHGHTHSGKCHVKTQTQREDGHVEMEAETGVMLPQTKERLEVPEAGGGKEGSTPIEALVGARPCRQLDFRL